MEKKVNRRLNLLRTLCGTWWGGHPQTLLTLYRVLIRSVLDYGSFIYATASKSRLAVLDRLQNRGLRICLGAMRSTNTMSLKVEGNEAPLALRRQYLADRYYFRTFAISRHPCCAAITNLQTVIDRGGYWARRPVPPLVNSIAEYHRLQPRLFSSALPLKHLGTMADLKSPVGDGVVIELPLDYSDAALPLDSQVETFLRINKSDYHVLYTDGSLTPQADESNVVGAGVFDATTGAEDRIHLDPLFSIFSAELIAILEAIKLARLSHASKILILSDSLSSLMAISNLNANTSRNYLVLRIKHSIRQARAASVAVELAWLPSHKGITGNERVDRLAKEGGLTGRTLPYKVPATDVYRLSKQRLQSRWQTDWTALIGARVTSLRLYKPMVGPPWFATCRFSRYGITSLTRMRLGHVSTRAHLSRLRILRDPQCRCQTGDETVEHIFFACPLYDVQSRQHLLLLLYGADPRLITVSDVLRTNNLQLYSYLFAYLQNNTIRI